MPEVSPLRKEMFVLTYERQRRYEGAWHTEVWPLFPGYRLISADSEESLENELQETAAALGIAQKEMTVYPITEENKRFLTELCGDGHHLPMSEGYIKDGRTYVTSGPLRGKEAWIRKIDRHKRLAKLELPDEGEGRELCMGLEIVRKE